MSSDAATAAAAAGGASGHGSLGYAGGLPEEPPPQDEAVPSSSPPPPPPALSTVPTGSAISMLTQEDGTVPPNNSQSYLSCAGSHAGSVLSVWPSPYTLDRATGARISIIRKIYRDRAAEQRSGVLRGSLLCLVLYLGVAVAVYGYGLEQWGVIKALYFAVSTFTTVGFGDITPVSQRDRLFTTFFALVGVAIVGVALSEIVSYLVEKNAEKMEALNQAVSRRIVERANKQRLAAAEAAEAAAARHPLNDDDDDDDIENGDGAVVVEEIIEGGVQQGVGRGGKRRGGGAAAATAASSSSATEAGADHHGDGGGSWSEFCLILTKALVPVVVVNVIGAGLIGGLEGWTVIDSLYYAVMSCTSIGYGDLHPDKPATYLLATIYLPLSVAAVGIAISTVTSHLIYKRAERRRRAELLRLAEGWEILGSMDSDHDGEIEKVDFLKYMLLVLELVDEEVLQQIEERYNELDVKGEGILRRENLRAQRREQEEQQRVLRGIHEQQARLMQRQQEQQSSNAGVSRRCSTVVGGE